MCIRDGPGGSAAVHSGVRQGEDGDLSLVGIVIGDGHLEGTRQRIDVIVLGHSHGLGLHGIDAGDGPSAGLQSAGVSDSLSFLVGIERSVCLLYTSRCV